MARRQHLEALVEKLLVGLVEEVIAGRLG